MVELNEDPAPIRKRKASEIEERAPLVRVDEDVQITLLASFLIFLLLTLVSCADFPRDPKKTLERAKGETLKVGVSESFPWVIREGDDALGVEPELVRRFADSIDAEIEWIWGAPDDHYASLEHYELHLALTGVTASSPWAKHLGFSQPYHKSKVVVGKPPSAPSLSEIDGLKVLVPRAGPYAGWVRDHDGVPVPTVELEGADALVAADDWDLSRLGLDPSDVVLHEHQHVMAAPPGENGFLMALENSFHGADVDSLIDEAMQHRKSQTTFEPEPEGAAE